MQITEKMRLALLKEEFKLRKKQPQSWTAQKYRKYANIGLKKKKEKPEFIEEEKEMESRLLGEEAIVHKKREKAHASAEKRKARKSVKKAKKKRQNRKPTKRIVKKARRHKKR